MKTAAKVDEFGHRRSARWTHATTDTKVQWNSRTVTSILSHAVTERINAVDRADNSIANGMDANKNGSIGWQIGEGGLAQAQTHMDLMVKGEGL